MQLPDPSPGNARKRRPIRPRHRRLYLERLEDRSLLSVIDWKPSPIDLLASADRPGGTEPSSPALVGRSLSESSESRCRQVPGEETCELSRAGGDREAPPGEGGASNKSLAPTGQSPLEGVPPSPAPPPQVKLSLTTEAAAPLEMQVSAPEDPLPPPPSDPWPPDVTEDDTQPPGSEEPCHGVGVIEDNTVAYTENLEAYPEVEKIRAADIAEMSEGDTWYEDMPPDFSGAFFGDADSSLAWVYLFSADWGVDGAVDGSSWDYFLIAPPNESEAQAAQRVADPSLAAELGHQNLGELEVTVLPGAWEGRANVAPPAGPGDGLLEGSSDTSEIEATAPVRARALVGRAIAQWLGSETRDRVPATVQAGAGRAKQTVRMPHKRAVSRIAEVDASLSPGEDETAEALAAGIGAAVIRTSGRAGTSLGDSLAEENRSPWELLFAPAAFAFATPRRYQATILLVEHDEPTRDTYHELLAHQGYLVLSAGTGRDAWGVLRTPLAPIDLVLLDTALPDVSGATLYTRLRELHPRLPVVVCTGGDLDPSEMASFDELGVPYYLRKPIPREKLLATVQALLR
jgi:CheY-like chemotaxis protein